MTAKKKKIINRYETYIIPVLCMLMSWHLISVCYYMFVLDLQKRIEIYLIASACIVLVSAVLLFKRKLFPSIIICLLGICMIYIQLSS